MWTWTIEKVKASLWKQFLDETVEGKIWKAVSYMKPREAWGCVPALRVGASELAENEEKAQAFLDAFFPQMDEPDEEPYRKRSEQFQGQVVINGKTVEPSPTAKLLGVISNQELRWKEHVQQIIKRATKVSIALGGLRYLRPEQMQQLYRACVTPVVDYASTKNNIN